MSDYNPCLTAQQIAKTFIDGQNTITVFNEIDLALDKGESCAIVGASGSGKSTLLHILGGLETPTKGQVFWQDQDINQLKEAKMAHFRNHYLGFVYQFHHLLPEFCALENVAMPLLLRGDHKKQAYHQAQTYLDKVGLTERWSHYPAQLSGGERQRVAIARALVTQPACLLADEPTGNLDDHTSQSIIELLLDLQQHFQIALVMVTHHQGIAHQAQRCLTLEEGQLSDKSK